MFLIFLLHALFASSFPLSKIAVSSAAPLFFTGIRMMLGGSILIGYQYYRYKSVFPELKKYIFPIFLLAVFNVFLTNAPEFWSLKFLVSSKAAFIYSICPFLAALLSYFIFSEKITPKKMLGMVIGFAGLLIILLHESVAEQSIGGVGPISWPEIAVIVAASSTVYGWIIMRQLMEKKVCSALEANGLSMILGGVISMLMSPFLEAWTPVPVDNYSNFGLTLVLLILISNIICYNLYAYLLKKYSITLISFVGFIEPFFAAIYGWILLGETVSLYFYIASVIVLIGLYLFYSEEISQGQMKKVDDQDSLNSTQDTKIKK